MPDPPRLARTLGTMIVYGFARGDVGVDLAIAERLGAAVVEVLPDWARYPDPAAIRDRVADAGRTIHSAHACSGSRTIDAFRVDLSDPDPTAWRASLDDLKRCADWLAAAGGRCLVVHPGGLSDPADTPRRQEALARGLLALADHVAASGIVLCVENMPAGVHPGSRMADLAALVAELARPELALCLDTGHANIVSSAAEETLAAVGHLRTTHVHDNNGRQDTHDPPGVGTVDWDAWGASLDRIGYDGPVMLECIRHLRQHPEAIVEPFLRRLARLCGLDGDTASGSPSAG